MEHDNTIGASGTDAWRCPQNEHGTHLGVDGRLYRLSVGDEEVWAHLKGCCEYCGRAMYFTQRFVLDGERMTDSLDEVAIDGAKTFDVED